MNPEGTILQVRQTPLKSLKSVPDPGLPEEELVCFLPEAVKTLMLLYHIGFKLALVVPGGHGSWRSKIERDVPALDELFSVKVFINQVGNPNNMETAIGDCLAQMKAEAGNTVLISSDPADLRAGDKVGVHTVGVSSSLLGFNKQFGEGIPRLERIAELIPQIYFWRQKQRMLYLTDGVYRTFRGLSNRFSQFAERYGIQPAQMAALQKLRYGDEIAVSDLAKQMGLLRSSVSGLVSRMEREGLIKKRKDEQDNRVSKIYLTEKGRTIVRSLTSFSIETENFLENHLRKEELLLLSQLLGKIANAFTDHDSMATEERILSKTGLGDNS
jgi:DNA-binding MarR family transcriptional regulator